MSDALNYKRIQMNRRLRGIHMSEHSDVERKLTCPAQRDARRSPHSRLLGMGASTGSQRARLRLLGVQLRIGGLANDRLTARRHLHALVLDTQRGGLARLERAVEQRVRQRVVHVRLDRPA